MTMRKQPRYDQIMAALDGGEPYDAIAKRFRMTARDVWVYDNVRTHGYPSELPPRQAGPNGGKTMRIFTAYELASIDARHRAGESLDALAKEYRTGDSTLRRALHNNGYSTHKSSHKSEALKAAVVEEYRNGATTMDIQAKYGIGLCTINKIVKAAIGSEEIDAIRRRNYHAAQARRAAERAAQMDRRLAEEA